MPSDRATAPRARLASPVLAMAITVLVVAAALLPWSWQRLPDGLRFVGRLHPALLHLPIGMLVAVAALELVSLVRRSAPVAAATTALLWLAALAAVPSVLAGALLAAEGGYDDRTLTLHRWSGVATAVAAAWLLALRAGGLPGAAARAGYALLLAGSLALVVATGHSGGSLTHGEDHLARYWPWRAPPAPAATPADDAADRDPAAGRDAAAGEPADEQAGDQAGEPAGEPAEDPAQDPAEDSAVAADRRAPPVAAALPPPSDVDFATEVAPVLQQYCLRCHGADKQKGDIRLDRLDPDMGGGADAEGWRTALDAINAGEMPPDDEPQPTDAERRRVVRWLTESLRRAAVARQGERQTVLRRLTRAQYTHSLQELLSVDVDFGRWLPADGLSRMGFSNNGAVLQASSLHLEYYQQLARQALEAAIVTGERPAATRYLVTFGRGRGEGLVAGRTGGYQSVPLPTDDFTVDILDGDGRPVVARDADERRRLDGIRRRISVGLRGSSQDRFRVVDEGLLLLSALPHREVVPKSWQGPSPNVKLEMQRVFPRRGDFVMRVRASRGYLPTTQEELLLALDEPLGVTALGEAGAVRAAAGAVVLAAGASDQRKNLRQDGDALVPEQVPEPSDARLRLELPRDGCYQIDLVHPAVPPEAMPSVRLTVDGRHLDQRPELDAGQLRRGRAVTPLGAALLRAGGHTLRLGGPFFTGFSHVVVTPMPADHPLVARLAEQSQQRNAELMELVPAIRAYVGTRTDDGMDYATFDRSQEVRAPLGSAAVYTFRGRLEDLPIPEPDTGDLEELSGFMLLGLWNDHLVKSPRETGPPLLVESIEFEAPWYAEWPPASHAAIFFEPGPGEPQRSDEAAYTRELLRRFLSRAFRRPAAAAEVERYLAFWREVRGELPSYEESVQETLVAVLCSPSFLFLAEPVAAGGGEGALDQAALASRLSYFLWNGPPDRELCELAAAGALRRELLDQVDRLIDDPRVWRFVRAFTREWLRLDRHEAMAVDARKHPRYTRFVKRDMAEETYHFVHEVLAGDRSVLAFVDSDFAMLNQNLAEFYGVPGVRGNHFRPVPITPAQRRGGLLSQGSFLVGHSDGSEPHPIKRAVWLKARLLGDPPPPPPPNVPDLDPDTPGFDKLTLKQQLEVHRDSPSCRDCHAGIDPFGVAFERYSAIGLHEQERRGLRIDASTTLPDGTRIDGVDELKGWLLTQRRDQLVRALIEHLFAYALGRDVLFADEPELDRIFEQVRLSGYRMRAVIRSIAASPSFTRP